MKKVIYVCLIFLLLFSATFLGCTRQEKSQLAEKILIVHSYSLDYAWTAEIDAVITENLKEGEYIIKKYCMDTKKNTQVEFKINAGKKALEKVKAFEPDVIIATDDNAQEYFGKIVAENYDIPLVFCGVNSDIEKYNYKNKNVTGVLERPNIKKTLNTLEDALDNVKSYMVINDNSPTAAAFIKQFLTLLEYDKVQNTVLTNNFDEWKSAIKNVSADAVIIFTYHTIKGVSPEEVITWTRENLQVPSLGFLDFAVEEGLLLGNVESGYEHGQLASDMTKKILEGKKKAKDIDIVTASQGTMLVNRETVQRLGLDIDLFKGLADKIID